MALHAQQFFAEHLRLPFGESAIVGNTYYATPLPSLPLRLRIDFSRTIRADEYDGLRLAVIHPEKGEIDAAVLTFADHHTFTRRDAAHGLRPGTSGYARIQHFRDTDLVPWKGAETGELRAAIQRYAQTWLPGSWTGTTPSRSPALTVRKAPSMPISAAATRTR
ncbi:hypothetical protein [Streptomyces sp. NPDC003077]|uniref:hypothetical protein n=1 Tax=Streptomyces sp. NPDC003077 TaxID=3154443 RepID=UPI0033B2450E